MRGYRRWKARLWWRDVSRCGCWYEFDADDFPTMHRRKCGRWRWHRGDHREPSSNASREETVDG